MPEEKKRPKHAPRKTKLEELQEAKPKRGAIPVDPNAHLPAVIEPEVVGGLVIPESLPDPYLIIPDGLAFEEWAARAPEVKQVRDRLMGGQQALQDTSNSLLLRLCDYLIYGQKNYSEEQMAQYMDAERGAEMYGYSYDSIRYGSWLARKIPPAERAEYPGVTYTHLVAVAKLEPKDRKHWLTRAVSEHISAANLRRMIEGKATKQAGKRVRKPVPKVKPVEEPVDEMPELPEVPAFQFSAENLAAAAAQCYTLHSILFDQGEMLESNKNAKIDVVGITEAAKAVGQMISSLMVGLNEIEASQQPQPTQAA